LYEENHIFLFLLKNKASIWFEYLILKKEKLNNRNHIAESDGEDHIVVLLWSQNVGLETYVCIYGVGNRDENLARGPVNLPGPILTQRQPAQPDQ
jgi:hypothetical protein